METKQILKEFKRFETKDYKTKYKKSLVFLEENKDPELLEFDKDPIWQETNPRVVSEMAKKFNLVEEDLSFYVFQNRDLLRLQKLEGRVKELLKEGKKEIFWNSLELSDSKKIVEVSILTKYDEKSVSGRLYKAETEGGLFLIVKGKSRRGIRLSERERYFI